MEQSAFITWINKYFKGIVTRVTQTLNDTKNPLIYLHKRMLRREYSVTGKWESVNGVNTLVMADLVAMDSSLPLKMRDSIGKATGDIPKMGMEMKLNERQLTDLDVLVAQNGTAGTQESQIVAKLFNDTPKVIGGIHERNEAIFLEGLSTGITSVPDDKNVGTAIRVDFGYKTANKFGTAVVWSTAATATPFDDIQRVLDKASADGNTVTRIMMDRTAFKNMAKTTDMKNMVGWGLGFSGDFTKIPVPTDDQVKNSLKSRFGIDNIEIVDRSVKYEKNGVQTAYKPWADGAVVFLTADQVGSLVWAKLAEMNHPVEKVNYETSDEYILVSKYRENKPSLTEVTSSQARVVPVIGGVDAIYTLDSKTVQA